MNARESDDGRTGREHSPSAGWQETAEQMHAPLAHAVEEDPVTDAVDDLETDTMFQDTSTFSVVVS